MTIIVDETSSTGIGSQYTMYPKKETSPKSISLLDLDDHVIQNIVCYLDSTTYRNILQSCWKIYLLGRVPKVWLAVLKSRLYRLLCRTIFLIRPQSFGLPICPSALIQEAVYGAKPNFIGSQSLKYILDHYGPVTLTLCMMIKDLHYRSYVKEQTHWNSFPNSSASEPVKSKMLQESDMEMKLSSLKTLLSYQCLSVDLTGRVYLDVKVRVVTIHVDGRVEQGKMKFIQSRYRIGATSISGCDSQSRKYLKQLAKLFKEILPPTNRDITEEFVLMLLTTNWTDITSLQHAPPQRQMLFFVQAFSNAIPDYREALELVLYRSISDRWRFECDDKALQLKDNCGKTLIWCLAILGMKYGEQISESMHSYAKRVKQLELVLSNYPDQELILSLLTRVDQQSLIFDTLLTEDITNLPLGAKRINSVRFHLTDGFQLKVLRTRTITEKEGTEVVEDDLYFMLPNNEMIHPDEVPHRPAEIDNINKRERYGKLLKTKDLKAVTSLLQGCLYHDYRSGETKTPVINDAFVALFFIGLLPAPSGEQYETHEDKFSVYDLKEGLIKELTEDPLV